MSTDRELLELAAKADGMEWAESEEAAGLRMLRHDLKRTVLWNPLTDDGDALRLAVSLSLDIEIMIGEVWANGVDAQNYQLFEWHNNDKCAATRRAIVRTAAEIGRGM